MIYTLTSQQWKEKYILAQEKIDSILETIEVKSAENDKDTLDLLDDRLEKAYIYRDDCEKKYYDAVDYEKNGKSGRVTYLPRSDYGY